MEQHLHLMLIFFLKIFPALAQVRHPLPVLWMMPVRSESANQNLSSGVDAAIRLAVEDLKKQPAALGNYQIELHLVDTQCDLGKSLKALFDNLRAGPKYLLMLGGACPSVAETIAQSLHAFNLVQVSFMDTSPGLANRKWSRNLFSLVPSDRNVCWATVKLLQYFNWTRVGVISQDTARLSQMKTDLMQQLLKVQVPVVSSLSSSEDCDHVRKLKNDKVHVIIAFVEEDSASDLFCCAFRFRLFGPPYQWIVFDGGTGGWRLDRSFSACTVSSILTAADGAIRLQIQGLVNTNVPGISGRTPQDYLDSYHRLLQVQGRSQLHPLHAFAYDAVWVAALALSHVTEEVQHRRRVRSQGNITVSEEEVEAWMLLEALRRTEFEGVTGPVQFSDGERTSSIQLIQLQGGRGVPVALFSTFTKQLHLHRHLLVFRDQSGGDQTLLPPQRLHVDFWLYCLVCCATALTICLTLLVLCSLLVNRRLMMSSRGSRSQDLLLLLGLLLSSSSMMFIGFDGGVLSEETFELLCSAGLWTLSVAHTLVMIGLISKTWTLYFLHTVEPKPHQQSCLFLFCVFLLDVIVLSSWQILDPLRRVVLQHHFQDVQLQVFSERCSSRNTDQWITAVCGYRCPLLGLACFLSWSVRSAGGRCPDGVSGRRLMLSIFTLTTFSFSGMMVLLLMSHNPSVQFGLGSSLVLCCNVCLLNFLFVPRVFHCWWNNLQPEGKGDEEEEEEENGCEELRRFNKELKSLDAQLDVEIQAITATLRQMTETGTHMGDITSVGISKVDFSEREGLSGDNVNCPELVSRRLSVQLPILHHSYLPVGGGVCSSSSSLFHVPSSP